jgi:hypothetical protein
MPADRALVHVNSQSINRLVGAFFPVGIRPAPSQSRLAQTAERPAIPYN